MVTFNTILQSAYDGLANKDGDALYFVSDTHRVYKGGTLYTGKIELVSSFPASGEVGVVYIAESDLEGRIWQNGAWATVAKGFTGTVTETSEELTTAKAVAAYVTNALETAIGSGGVITSIAYEAKDAATSGTGNDERDLIITKGGGSTERLHLSDLVSSVEYDKDNLTLTFRMSCVDEPVVVNLPQDNFIVSGSYNPTTKDIELTLKDGSVIKIPAEALVDVYTGGSTATVTVGVSSSNEITANVKLSSSSDNILEAKTDGLYAPAPTGKLDVLPSGRGGEVIISQTSGDIEVSGATIGGATIASIPSPDVLATEAAVAAVRTTLQGSINAVQSSLSGKVDTSSITTTLSASNPSASKIPSESAVVAALTWRNLTT